MSVDGARADTETGSDLRAGQTVGDAFQHLGLPRCQRDGQALGLPVSEDSVASCPFRLGPRHGDVPLTVSNSAQTPKDVLTGQALGHEAAGTEIEGPSHESVLVMNGEDQRPRPSPSGPPVPRSRSPVPGSSPP